MQRTETIVAAFDTAKAADAAVQHLEAAKIPSAVIQKGGGSLPGNTRPGVQPLVTVAVDYKDADLVTGILDLYGPVDVVEQNGH
jgi:hypothetical protein